MYLDGVGKLAARTVTCWKPTVSRKRRNLAMDGASAMFPGKYKPAGLRKFCVGTGDAHGLLAEASKRAGQEVYYILSCLLPWEKPPPPRKQEL